MSKIQFKLSILCNVLLAIILAFIVRQTNYHNHILNKLGLTNSYIENRKTYDCQAGWTNSLKSLNDSIDIAFIGNSITYSCEWEKYLPAMKVCNLGYPSDNIQGMIDRVGQLAAVHPKKVFILGGVNDLNKKLSTDDIIIQYELLLDTIQKSLPLTDVYVQSVFPMNQDITPFPVVSNNVIKLFNVKLQNLSKKRKVNFVNIYPLLEVDGMLGSEYTYDGIHLTKKANDIWANEIMKTIY